MSRGQDGGSWGQRGRGELIVIEPWGLRKVTYFYFESHWRPFLSVTLKIWIFSPVVFFCYHFLSVSRTTFSHSFRVGLLARSWRLFLLDIKFGIDGSFRHLKNVPLPSDFPGFRWEIAVVWIDSIVYVRCHLSFVYFQTFSLVFRLRSMMYLGMDFLGFFHMWGSFSFLSE